jgi:hypothetical protein
MKTVSRILAASAALGLLAACAGQIKHASARNSVETVETEGLASYSAKDPEASVAAAVTEAQKNAIEAVAGLFQGAQPMVKYDALKQNLLKTPGLYIKKYKTLSERREGDLYRVEIRAYVYVDKVAYALRNPAIADMAGPGVSGALLLDEYFAAAPSSYVDARGAFTGYLGRKTAINFLDDQALKNSDDENAFFEAARASGADLVMIGRASAAPIGSAQGPQSGFYPARAKAELKIYESGTRRLLLEISGQANAMDTAQEGAFRKALVSAGEMLAQEAFSKADKFIRPAAPLTLRVRALSGIEDARKLKEAVERLGINGSVFESYRDGEAVMTVYPVRPDPQEFASALLRAGSFNLELESISQFEAVFSVIK